MRILSQGRLGYLAIASLSLMAGCDEQQQDTWDTHVDIQAEVRIDGAKAGDDQDIQLRIRRTGELAKYSMTVGVVMFPDGAMQPATVAPLVPESSQDAFLPNEQSSPQQNNAMGGQLKLAPCEASECTSVFSTRVTSSSSEPDYFAVTLLGAAAVPAGLEYAEVFQVDLVIAPAH